MHSADKHSISACDEFGLVRLTMSIEDVEGVNGHDAGFPQETGPSNPSAINQKSLMSLFQYRLVWLMADGLV
jgi:hypothetical protein